SAVIPPLLTVKPNAYRGILSAAQRLPTVGFGVKLAPDKEQLAGATVELTVVDARGEPSATASTTVADDRQALSYRQDVTLDQGLPAGDYVVRATLVSGTKTLAKADAKFKIVAPQPAQTIV